MSATESKQELIEKRIDKGVAGTLSITADAGGMAFGTMVEVMEFSKVMAISGQAIPPHLRNNVGACLAICIQAVEWRMSPFAVANKSYVVNDRIAYESQLIHAIIEQRAPLVGRLRHSFAGEGDNRTCTVTAMARGESEPLTYTSPPIGKITPKNSPLWKTKPDLQLFYNTSRDWARAYFPDVLMGVYAADEIVEAHVSYHKTPRSLGELAAAKVAPRPDTPEPSADRQLGLVEAFREQIDALTDEPAIRDAYEEAASPHGHATELEAAAMAAAMKERISQLKGSAS